LYSYKMRTVHTTLQCRLHRISLHSDILNVNTLRCKRQSLHIGILNVSNIMCKRNCINLKKDVGGGGRDPKKITIILCHISKETKTNIRVVGRRCLLQHYWIKVPVLLVVEYYDGCAVTVLYWYKPNQKMGSKLTKGRMNIDSQDIYPRPPRLYMTLYGVATISRLLKITGLFCRI